MSNIEVGHINAIIDQAASRIVEAVIARLKDTCSSVELKQLDEHVDHLTRQVLQLEGLYKKLSEPPPQTAECKCGERITALAETNDQDFVEIRGWMDQMTQKLHNLATGDNEMQPSAVKGKLTILHGEVVLVKEDLVEIRRQVDTLDERVDKLSLLASDSGSEFARLSIRLDNLSSEINQLRGIKQDPASLVKRLEAVEEKEVYLERIIHNVRGILIAAATKVEQDL